MTSTDPSYAARLQRLSSRRWKRWIPNPYRWHLRRIASGRVLEIGCGIGRCLGYLGRRATGVDPNEAAVGVARAAGHDAWTPDTLPDDIAGTAFDALLTSHVLEHLDVEHATALVARWLPCVRPGGRVVLICPQERGFASDATHVTYLDGRALVRLCESVGVSVERTYSFPLPRRCGRWWIHNETIVIGRTASAARAAT